MTRATNNRRAAFTLIELLVVVTIMLILAYLVFSVFNANRSSDRMRSAARVAQSAFLGAKDRALHAKDLRGVRLTRDLTDPTLVNGFVYLQPIPNLIYGQGSIQLERHSPNGPSPVGQNPPSADSPDIIFVRGLLGTDFDVKQIFFASPYRIRIPAGTGQWYNFFIDTTGQYALSSGNEYLRLASPFVNSASANPMPFQVAYDQSSGYSSCEIQLGNEVLPFHAPISLSSGVVIDLKYSSQAVQALSGVNLSPQPAILPNIDIMFSPRGMVSGPIGAQGPLHFLLRDLQDATATSATPNAGIMVGPNDPNKGDRMILSVFPQTGLVQAFEIDQTDANNDGLADNIFAFAVAGKSAGR